MELKDFVKAKLIADGLNGLSYFDGDGCACHVDDLMPCGEPHPDCKACILKTMVDCGDEECEWRGDEHYHEATPSAPADVCPRCQGSKMEPGEVHYPAHGWSKRPCKTCHGSGHRPTGGGE